MAMKILYITNGFPPHRWAGTETYTAGIAKGICESGNDVQVLCAGRWEGEGNRFYWNGFQDDVYNGIPVRRLHLNWQKSPDPNRFLYCNPFIEYYVEKFIDELKPDIVHVTSCETLSASVIEAAKTKNIPTILSLTDLWFLCPRMNLLQPDGKNCSGNKTAWDCQHCLLADSNLYHKSQKILPKPVVKAAVSLISERLPSISRQRGLRGMALNMKERKSYLRRIFSLADVRLTASQFIKDIFIQNGFDDAIHIHPYGHDLGWLQKFHGKTLSNKIRLGYIGQIVPSKGLHILLEAMKLLNISHADRFHLSIYGSPKHDPDYYHTLKIASSEFNNIEFCGTYAHDESGRVFATFDILVVPSLWYDFPLVIYEAFATKTPVIATNLGGMAEAVIHEKNGLLFERGNVLELTNQLKRILLEVDVLVKITDGIPSVKSTSDEVRELVTIYEKILYNYSSSRLMNAIPVE